MNNNVKNLILQFTPPIVVNLYKHLNGRGGDQRNDGGDHSAIDADQPFYIWDGIYNHYRDILSSNSYLGSDQHIADVVSDMQSRMTVAKHYRTIPAEVVGEHILLPLLASVLYEKQGELNILDFGGGVGIAYLQLLSSIPGNTNVNYHVVELDRICESGTQLFSDDQRIHFHSALPENLADLDILHINSSLQYIEDYAGLLNRLCTYQPKYFLFVRLSAGDVPTYATAQKNMPGDPIPYWFLNVDELIEIMLQNDYSLIFKSALEQEYNQDNFPEEYRLRRTANLLFARG